MAAFVGTNGNDTFIGTESNDSFEGRAGNDNMQGRGGNDAFNMSLGGTSSYGSDIIDGGTAYDTIWFDGYAVTGLIVDFAAGTITGGGVAGAGSVSFSNVERVIGGSSADQMTGSAIGQNLSGIGGDDTLRGAGGSDWIWGGSGADRIVYGEAGTANADQIGDFTSGIDKIVLDGGMLTGLGTEGNFAAGDARFTANSSGTAQDASDRIIYNTATRQIFYDADGAGGAAAQLIATLQSGATLVATDIAVEGGGSGGGGTEGDDTLIGTEGPDTLDGRGGNDTIRGLGGNDTLIGGTGNDLLDGGSGSDSMDGGTGDDTYVVLGDGDALTDAGGIDTVIAHNSGWQLAAGFENLTLTGDPIVGFFERSGTGNEQDNVIRNDVPAGSSGGIWWMDGLGGDDMVIGSDGTEHFLFNSATGNYGHDSIDGRGGMDAMLVGQSSAVVVDFGAGTLAGGGAGGAGSADFVNVEIVSASSSNAFEDLFIGGDVDATAYGGAGNDTFLGGAGDEFFHDDDIWLSNGFFIETGDDTLSGGGGNDWLVINRGNDSVDGGTGDDTVFIDAGFYFIDYGTDEIDGGSGTDTLSIMAASAITVDLGAGTMVGGGEGGSGSATLASIENFDTTRGAEDFDHNVTGSAGANTLSTRFGDDVLNGAGGNDVLTSGSGADVLVFDQAPGAANADMVTAFAPGADTLRLHASVMPALGASGDFVAGDSRFAANSMGSAQDSSDRIVYNTSNGQLFYDADGNGGGAALLIATLQGAPTLTATDITVAGGSSGSGGTEGDDTIVGTEGNDILRGFGGNDTIHGLGGDDVIIPGADDDTVFAGSGDDNIGMSSGNFDQPVGNQGSDDIDGGEGVDSLGFSIEGVSSTQAVTIDLGAGTYSLAGPDPASGTVTGIEEVQGSWFDDAMTGSSAANFLGGWSGNDLLNGRGGNDTLGDEGGGADVFVFDQAPGATHADTVMNFASDDQIRLDATVMPALGASGNFATGDARFAANSSGTAQDSSDRVVYNTTTGQLWYDADGNAAGAALLIATLQGAPALAASDIEVVNGGTQGQTITGTSGNDNLVGTDGDDTLDGLGGADTMDGRLGNDTYHVTTGDVLIDSGGIDTVVTPINWTLGLDFENLTMTGTASIQAQGNNSDNFVIGNSGNNYFNLRAGDDTIQAGAGNDVIDMSRGGTASYGNDVVDGGDHFDRIDFDGYASSGIVANFDTGTITGGGDGGAGSVSFTNIERIIGGSSNDQITGDGIGNHLDGRNGLDTLIAGGGNDTLWGGGDVDWLEGGTGNDWLNGGAGADAFAFRDAPGAANADTINDFASGSDKVRLDDATHAGIGAVGNFSAGDARFFANAGASSGADGSDRVVYNTSTGQLYYDADGSGSGAAQLIAVLDGAPTITATDIYVI